MLTSELKQGFQIGSWRIEPKLNRFSIQENGEVIEHVVTPKVMDLCLLLASQEKQPVSQQEIADEVWPDLAISDSSIYQAVAQLRKALNDTQPQKHIIERVSGKGYRLIKTCTPLNKAVESPSHVFDRPQTKSKNSNVSKLLGGAALTLIILTYFWYFPVQNEAGSPPSNVTNKPDLLNISSIAIRPTQNFSKPKLGQIDTFSHLLLSDLLAIPNINLILMRDKEQSSNADVELTSRISNEGNTLILSAQLIERHNKRIIWASDFIAQGKTLLNLKSQLTNALATVLKTNSSTLDTNSNQSLTGSLEESFVLAQYLWNKREPETLDTAKTLYSEILQQQPEHIETLIGLCNTYLFLHTYSDWTKQKALSTCRPLIDKASSLSPQSGKVLATKALLLTDNDPEKAAELFQESIALTPNYTNAYLWYGFLLRTIGKTEEALAMHQRALSLDPLSPIINRSLAYSLLNLRQLQTAKRYYQRALIIEPQYSLRPVEELDFLPLNIARAKQFIAWTKEDKSNLSQWAPYLLTQALVRLGLGQTAEATRLIELADKSQVNRDFWLYTQAALSASKGDTKQAKLLLKERYLNGTTQQKNTNRHVMPYLSLLMHNRQYDEAYNLFLSHFPHINANGDISDENSGQFIFLHALLLSVGHAEETRAIALKIANHLGNLEQPPLTLPYIQWLLQSKQSQATKSAIEALFIEGWLPDFNDNILSEINFRKAYTSAGGDPQQFNKLLKQNRRYALN